VTKVINLITLEELLYSLPPDEAVRSAYCYYLLKNGNTWAYKDIKVPMLIGRHSVSCGDYAALLNNELFPVKNGGANIPLSLEMDCIVA
jgi:hypothetical protein